MKVILATFERHVSASFFVHSEHVYIEYYHHYEMFRR